MEEITITIKYEYLADDLYNPYAASTKIDDNYLIAVSSKSFKDAKTELLKKIENALINITIPKPEEIKLSRKTK